MKEVPVYRYRGARALVILHERHLREFLETWRKAKASSLRLPRTEDPAYASLERLLRHVLSAARGYMTWMCEMLELPDPRIDEPPGIEAVAEEAEAYLEHLLRQWRTPLADVEEERFDHPTYTSRWKVPYCIDAMLEHAVMHPIRHRFQLLELMEGQSAESRMTSC